LEDSAHNWVPNAADLESFRLQGWLVTPVILPKSLLEEARFGVQRLYAGERDSPLPLSGGYLDWQPEHGRGIRINDYVSLQIDELATLVRYEPLARIAGMLANTSIIRLFHDQLVSKPAAEPAVTAVGWHTDQAYWSMCSSPNMLTAWIPFDDQDDRTGGLEVIDGSHLWPGHLWMRTFNEKDLEKLLGRVSPPPGVTPCIKRLDLKLGQVSFHHARTIHGSPPNRSSQFRIALTIHYQPADNSYVSTFLPEGKKAVHLNDVLCRAQSGFPDYHDPAICPVLWSET
jgi:ectoine hydroxylase-related dioxygenase (phytanoyl-CoA dioxygenase family)